MFFYEISSTKIFENETVDFVEKEFNDFLLAEAMMHKRINNKH